jgi:hypothetical protein
MEWRSLATLTAGQETTLYARRPGAVVLQTGGDSAVRVIGGGRDVQTLPLSAERLRQTIGSPDGTPTIVTIAVLPGGSLVLATSGASRQRSLASLQVYDIASDRLTLLSTAAELASASGLGDSLDIADLQLAAAGQVVWLWLRQPDRSVLLQYDARQLESGVARAGRPFTQWTWDDQPLRIGQAVLTGRVDGGFWLLESGAKGTASKLWQIDAQGAAVPADWPVDAPAPTVPPLPLGDGPDAPQLYFFGRPRDTDASQPIGGARHERYPVLEIRGRGKTLTRFDREAIVVRPTFPLHALRLTAWCRDAQTGDVIAYDRLSGEVFRITLPRGRND